MERKEWGKKIVVSFLGGNQLIEQNLKVTYISQTHNVINTLRKH